MIELYKTFAENEKMKMHMIQEITDLHYISCKSIMICINLVSPMNGANFRSAI